MHLHLVTKKSNGQKFQFVGKIALIKLNDREKRRTTRTIQMHFLMHCHVRNIISRLIQICVVCSGRVFTLHRYQTDWPATNPLNFWNAFASFCVCFEIKLNYFLNICVYDEFDNAIGTCWPCHKNVHYLHCWKISLCLSWVNLIKTKRSFIIFPNEIPTNL